MNRFYTSWSCFKASFDPHPYHGIIPSNPLLKLLEKYVDSSSSSVSFWGVKQAQPRFINLLPKILYPVTLLLKAFIQFTMLLWFLFVKVPAPDIFLVQVQSLKVSSHFAKFSEGLQSFFFAAESTFRSNANCCYVGEFMETCGVCCRLA